MTLAIYIGWDPREPEAYEVCAHSLRTHARGAIEIRPIRLDELRRKGLYTRPTEMRDGRLWDVISEAPMSTEFAISRFFTPLLADSDQAPGDYALFMDCDFLWTGDVTEILGLADPACAVACVQHVHLPTESVKMDGQLQLLYARKNWSSLLLFNRRHPANIGLGLDLLNSVPGRDLHRFCWLDDRQIQALPREWNWLEGSYPAQTTPPLAIHYTRGGPWMEGWENVAYAELWRAARVAARQAASDAVPGA